MKERVLADAAVLEERMRELMMTPLIYTIDQRKPAIAHWLIEHRGQHDLDIKDSDGGTALHWACWEGFLSVVQALLAAGASATLICDRGRTPLTEASQTGHVDIVAYLLQLPAVRAAIDTLSNNGWTAICLASFQGHASVVQLLLDAGADPINPGPSSGYVTPLRNALKYGHTAVATLLHCAIAEPDRARALHKARALLDAAHIDRKTKQDARDKGETVAVQKQQAITAAPIYLKARVERVERVEALPQVELAHEHNDGELHATVAFAIGLEGDGSEEKYKHLPREPFKELLGYLMHLWADKGPNAVEDEQEQ